MSTDDAPPNAPVLEYHGFSSFGIRFEDTHVLVDPWIDEPPWTTASVADFDDVDLLFVTHGAYDHLGDAAAIGETSGAEIITEPAVADHLIATGVAESQVTRAIWGNHLHRDGVSVRCLETRHLSYFESQGRLTTGLPLGFHFDFGSSSLYYLGDTSIFSDLELFGRLYEPDRAVVPVGSAPGSNAPLPPREAAIASTWFGVEEVIPVHYVPGSEEVTEFEQHLTKERGENETPAVARLDVGDRLPLSG